MPRLSSCHYCRRLWFLGIMLLLLYETQHVMVVRAWLIQRVLLQQQQLQQPPSRSRLIGTAAMRLLSSASTTTTTTARRTFRSNRSNNNVLSAAAATTISTAQAANNNNKNDVDNDESLLVIKVPRNFQPYPFEYWQELDVTIEALTNRGLGIARVEVPPNEEENEVDDSISHENTLATGSHSLDNNNNNNKKWVIMVPNVIPGERVRVRIFRNFANYSEADLIKVLEASQDRVEPVCSLASICGGCQFQHMSINAQRMHKTWHVQEALEQYGLMIADNNSNNSNNNNGVVSPCLGTDEIYEYRSKLTPHYQQPSKSRRGKSNNTDNASSSSSSSSNNDDTQKQKQQHHHMITAIGFQKQNARQIIDVPVCPIATPAVNQAYQRARETLLQEPPKNTKRGATLLFRQANNNNNNNLNDDTNNNSVVVVETNHKNTMTTRVRGLDFTYRAGNFFQNNYYVLPLMVEHVVEQATKPIKKKLVNSNNNNNNHGSAGTALTHLADCYCGSGLFAISAASHFERVVGIEINDMAIAEATANAIANNISNCEFKASSAENIFHVIQDFPRNQTVVVLDPPRKGCSSDFLKQLYNFGPQRIVYMSCDPTTQARDVAGMVQEGYEITFVQPFDLFPQTRHIECLMVLERNDDSVIE